MSHAWDSTTLLLSSLLSSHLVRSRTKLGQVKRVHYIRGNCQPIGNPLPLLGFNYVPRFGDILQSKLVPYLVDCDIVESA